MKSSRTQLNINISPELIKTLKQNAIKSGMTLANYVTQLIKVYVSNEDLVEDEENFNSRIENIEKQLEDISKKIQLLTKDDQIRNKDNANYKITGFSKEGAIAFSEAANHFFYDECKKRNLNTKEAVIELTPFIQNHFNMGYWGTVIKMFADNEIRTSNELMFKIYKDHGSNCPLYEVFYRWTGRKPKLIEQKILEAAIY